MEACLQDCRGRGEVALRFAPRDSQKCKSGDEVGKEILPEGAGRCLDLSEGGALRRNGQLRRLSDLDDGIAEKKQREEGEAGKKVGTEWGSTDRT